MTDKRVFSDKYAVESEIARGGMGVVYKAVHTALGRGVALKVLHSQYSGDPAFVQRFLREARAMARLDHANIIRVFDVAEDAGSHYIVMEYFPAIDLKRVILERSDLPVDECLAIGEQIAEGLAYAHEQGIVHRDIKPGNVMISESGQVKIADFGIAAAADEISVTATGQVLGTPEYMSPEQARGDELDGRSDLYSLGMVLYELLTGRTPFKSISKMAIVGKLLYEDAELPLDFPPQVPEPLRELVRTLLCRDPAGRVADAATLVSRLREIRAAIEMGGAQPTPPPEDAGEATLVMDRPPTGSGPEAAAPTGLTGAQEAAAPAAASAAPAGGTGRAETGAERAPTPADLGYAPQPPKRLPVPVLAGAAGGVAVLALIAFFVFSGGESESPPTPAPAPIATPAPAPPAASPEVADRARTLAEQVARLEAEAADARANAEALGADTRAADTFAAARERQADGVDRAASGRRALEDGRFGEAGAALDEGQSFLTSAIDGFTAARTQAASAVAAEKAAAERQRLADQRAEAERRRLAAEAERRRAEEAAARRDEQTARQETPVVARTTPGSTTRAGRADIEVVGEMLAVFKSAYEHRDLSTMAEVSRLSDSRQKFLKEIFAAYPTIEVSVSGFNLVQDRASAVVTIEKLVGTDGNIVIPSAAWRSAKLSMRKRGGEWQRIEW
jgi:hypothetical protein